MFQIRTNHLLIAIIMGFRMVDQGYPTLPHTSRLIIYEFYRTFDKSDQTILIDGLHYVGFSQCESVIDLLTSYSSNRNQFGFYNGYWSVTYIATSGIPQASNLKHYLFFAYVNKLWYNFSFVSILSIADNLTIYAAAKSNDSCILLQHDLVEIHRWRILRIISNWTSLNVKLFPT